MRSEMGAIAAAGQEKRCRVRRIAVGKRRRAQASSRDEMEEASFSGEVRRLTSGYLYVALVSGGEVLFQLSLSFYFLVWPQSAKKLVRASRCSAGPGAHAQSRFIYWQEGERRCSGPNADHGPPKKPLKPPMAGLFCGVPSSASQRAYSRVNH